MTIYKVLGILRDFTNKYFKGKGNELAMEKNKTSETEYVHTHTHTHTHIHALHQRVSRTSWNIALMLGK